jgi:hypothetical protein
VSALKLFDPSLKIRGPAVVKQAKFIRDRKVPTNWNCCETKDTIISLALVGQMCLFDKLLLQWMEWIFKKLETTVLYFMELLLQTAATQISLVSIYLGMLFWPVSENCGFV